MTTEEREVIRDFIVTVVRAEVRSAASVIKGLPGESGSPGLRGEVGEPGQRGEPGPTGPVIAGEKGEPGATGARGLDGRDGRDGKDGIASRDEVRAEAAKAVEELRAELLIEVKKAAAEEIAALPTMQHKGVWKEGEYRAGDCVSWAGSTWHAVLKTAEKPGDGATAWVLIAKRGNPGKDAK